MKNALQQFGELAVVGRDGHVEASDQFVRSQANRDGEYAGGFDEGVRGEIEVEEGFGFGEEFSKRDGTFGCESSFGEEEAFKTRVHCEGGSKRGDLLQ